MAISLSLHHSTGQIIIINPLVTNVPHHIETSQLICRKLRIWSHLLKKFLTENFIFCAVYGVMFSCKILSMQVILNSFKTLCKSMDWFLYDWDSSHERVNNNLKKIIKRPVERSSHRGCLIKKGVLKNLLKYTGKHQCQSLFFNKVADLSLQLHLKREPNTGVFL